MNDLEKIRLIRRMKNIDQGSFARMLGKSQSTYSDIEAGKVKLTEEMKKDIMEKLSITEELFEKLDEKTILNINDQNGGNAGQFVSANDMDEIIKVVNEVASPYKELIEQCKSQIKYLEEENRFLKALLAEKRS